MVFVSARRAAAEQAQRDHLIIVLIWGQYTYLYRHAAHVPDAKVKISILSPNREMLMHAERAGLAALAMTCLCQNAIGDARQIVLTDEIIECFFGEDRRLNAASEEKVLLDYVRLALSGEDDPALRNALAQRCSNVQAASAKRTHKFELSGYDLEEPGADMRDYDIRYSFGTGPNVPVPLLREFNNLKWSTGFELFASRHELQGVDENQDRNTIGFNIGSFKYLRWKPFQPFLSLGYFHLDKKISSAASGLITEDSNTHNFSFRIGADINPWEDATIVVEHGVGTEGIFGRKTAARTGAKIEVEW